MQCFSFCLFCPSAFPITDEFEISPFFQKIFWIFFSDFFKGRIPDRSSLRTAAVRHRLQVRFRIRVGSGSEGIRKQDSCLMDLRKKDRCHKKHLFFRSVPELCMILSFCFPFGTEISYEKSTELLRLHQNMPPYPQMSFEPPKGRYYYPHFADEETEAWMN